MKKKVPDEPGDIDGPGEHESFYHAMILSDCVRIQVNAEKPLYLKKKKEVKKLARWLLKASEFIK